MRFAHFQFDPQTDRLGEGPSSEVFRAEDTRLGRTVALKILRPHVEFDPAAKERFEREAKHTSNLAHPNIATIYEYGQDRGTSFIAMEYLEGRTLDAILKDHRLGYDEGMAIALQVFPAVKLVHQRGLIHRDLKPANIMVLDDGLVKLLDFGICRSTAESNITQENRASNTCTRTLCVIDDFFRRSIKRLMIVRLHSYSDSIITHDRQNPPDKKAASPR